MKEINSDYLKWRMSEARSVTFAEVVANQSCPYVNCQAAKGTDCFRAKQPHRSRVESYYGALYVIETIKAREVSECHS